MNIYIWQRIDQATGNYHSEGGVVVFAETEERARELANAKRSDDIEYDCHIKTEEMPDHVRPCADGPEQVFIFPDAGCC